MDSRLTPNEVWLRSKSSYSALVSAHPWGCPVYVLHPWLQDGGTISKWEPQSWQVQYMGKSRLHSSTVGLIWNIRTHNISPQFHVVYDDAFRTVHSGDNVPTNSWSDLLIFKIFKSDYYESYFVPGLTDYWLTPIEANRRQEAVADHRGLAISDMVTNGDERRSQKAPSTEEDNNALDMSSQRASSTVSSTVDLSQ